MAKKQSPKKRFVKKVHDLTRKDIVTSVAAVSILLNVLFLVTVLVLTNTETFSREIFTATRDQYCTNLKSVRKHADKIGSFKEALKQHRIDCVADDFLPFYNEAIEKYRAHTVEQ